MNSKRLTVVLAIIGICAMSGAGAATFQGLGFLSTLNPYSDAGGISADGSMVVGNTTNDDGFQQGYVWTAANGIVPIPYINPLDSNPYGSGNAVSNNGVAVGQSYNADGPLQGYQWTAGGGTVAIPYTFPYSSGNNAYGTATGVSSNGSIIVGADSDQSTIPSVAFRWTSATGSVALPYLSGGGTSWANGISADGSTIVGYSDSATTPLVPVRWTSGGASVSAIPLPSGYTFGEAFAASTDGSTVAGRIGDSNSTYQPFRWTEGGGTQVLNSLDDTVDSEVLAVSGDGNILVGDSNGVAVMWDANGDVTNLMTLFTTVYGLDVSAWATLDCACGISADGTVITGCGTLLNGDGEAWLFTVPEPSTYALLALGAGVFLIFRKRRK